MPGSRIPAVLLFTFAVTATGFTASAQSLDATAFSLVSMAGSARGAALGGAVSASPSDDAAAFFFNPALLHADHSGVVGLSFLDHVSSVRGAAVSYGQTLAGVGMIAGSVRYMGWGEIPRRDEFGTETGSFRANELVLTVAGSMPRGDRIRFGASVNVLRSGFDSFSASALTVDAGAVYHAPEQGFAASASVHQAGLVLSSIGSERESLPFDVRLGISKRLQHLPVTLTMTAYGLVDYTEDGVGTGVLDQAFRHLLLGAEFRFGAAFHARLGYDHRAHAALKMKSRLDSAGLSFGFGLRLRRIRIDYARTSWSSLGGMNRFTIATSL